MIKEHDLFFKAVSLCHIVQISSVQTDSTSDGPWQSNFASSQLEYYASSPDEKALVEAAARFGIVFIGNSEETMEVKTLGKLERYKLFHILEFDSDLRRTSVIVQAPSGEKLLFAKGAESSILPQCIGGEIEKTRIHVDEFALVSADFSYFKNAKMKKNAFIYMKDLRFHFYISILSSIIEILQFQLHYMLAPHSFIKKLLLTC